MAAGPRDPRPAADAAAQRDADARDHRHRPRAHRHGVAVAAGGDLPQVRADLRDPGAAHGALPDVPLRLLAGPAVRVDPRPRARALGADPRARRRRAVAPGRRDVDRARLQPARRRVARAPVPPRPALLRARVRPPRRACSGIPTCSATTASCRRSCAAPGSTASSRRSSRGTGSTRPSTTPSAGSGSTARQCSRTSRRPTPTTPRRPSPSCAARPRDFKDHALSARSLLVFGWGDGGGGPTAQMLETLAPRRGPAGRPAHDDRRSGGLLRAAGRGGASGPRWSASSTSSTTAGRTRRRRAPSGRAGARSGRCTTPSCSRPSRMSRGRARSSSGAWQTLLLNHFHDILPGSSIGEVHARAERDLAEVEAAAGAVRDRFVRRRRWSTRSACARREVVAASGDLRFAEAPSCGVGQPRRGSLARCASRRPPTASCSRTSTCARCSAATARCARSSSWRADARRWPRPGTSSSSTRTARPTSRPGTSTRSTSRRAATARRPRAPRSRWRTRCAPRSRSSARSGAPAACARPCASTPSRARLEFHCAIDWHEDRRALKVRFPVAVHAPRATYEMQFGVVERPTHYSTRRDLAQYEVPGHRFADLSEHGFGVALLSAATYGWSVHGGDMRMTLLRSPALARPRGRRRPPRAGLRDPPASRRLAGGRRHRAGPVLQRAAAARRAGGARRARGSRPTPPASSSTPSSAPRTATTSSSASTRPTAAAASARLRVGLPFAEAWFTNLLEDRLAAGRGRRRRGRRPVPAVRDRDARTPPAVSHRDRPQPTAGGSCRRITLLRLRRLRLRTCPPPPARGRLCPAGRQRPRRGPRASTPSRPQLLRRARCAAALRRSIARPWSASAFAANGASPPSWNRPAEVNRRQSTSGSRPTTYVSVLPSTRKDERGLSGAIRRCTPGCAAAAAATRHGVTSTPDGARQPAGLPRTRG